MQDFEKLKNKVIDKAMPNAPEGALQGWDHWTGHGIKDDKAFEDDEYLEAKALHEKRKKHLIAARNDGHLKHVILSDEISKQSSKYVVKWQPDWVNIGMYRHKMNDTLGREWNLSTEFFDSIKPDYDIPHGYIVKPTIKEDDTENDMKYKTSFGNKNKNQKQNGKKKEYKLQSVYNNDNLVNKKKRKYVDDRPERGKS